MRSSRYSQGNGPAGNGQLSGPLLFNVPDAEVIPPQSLATANDPASNGPAPAIRRMTATAATCMGIYVCAVVIGWAVMAVIVGAWFHGGHQ